jgi:sarcosine oxidase
MRADTYDVAVIGSGVFGVWTAYLLRQSGAEVILLDAHGPGNSRASSGGESRIIRMGYGPDEIYSRSALRSLSLWREFFARIEPPTMPTSQRLFRQTGVLWLATESDSYCESTLEILTRLGVYVERLEPSELQRRYPQISFAGVNWGILEPASGALMARRAVQALAAQTEAEGTTIKRESVALIGDESRLDFISTAQSPRILADKFVFACGPWLPKLFPDILGQKIHVTRQEVFFFGTPAGDKRFGPDETPIWVDFNDQAYAIPDLEQRGFKIAIDAHGPEFDPDTGERVGTEAGIKAARTYLTKRVPDLANAPVIESRVCQYENTSNGDFLIDRHPHFENVWFVGGGSGHGFKHGPAVAEYVLSMISGSATTEPRFALQTKETVQHRQVY